VAITGVGTDISRSARFEKFLDKGKEGVLLRLFTEGERDYALGKRHPAPHLAARFAAKEAFLKALRTGLREGISWQDMEVLRDELGAPSLRLSGRAAEIAAAQGVVRVHLSYSHDGDYSMATVVLEDG